MVNKELKIYLAGKMSGLSLNEMTKWRKLFKTGLTKYGELKGCNVEVISPVDYYNFEEKKKHQNEMEVMKFDLSLMKKSDIVIANLQDINTSIGTCIEVYEAWRIGIPVIGYGYGGSEVYGEIHPWIANCLTRIEKSDKDTCQYIADFYMK